MATAWAAGVLPVATHPATGEAMVLLGLDARAKGGKWSDFAGGGEAGDATPAHTALRELAEETGGALTLRLEDLDGAMRLGGVTPSGKRLHRFVARVPFDAALPARFCGAKDREKTAIAWFPLAALPRMRFVFAAQMRADGAAIARFAVTPSS